MQPSSGKNLRLYPGLSAWDVKTPRDIQLACGHIYVGDEHLPGIPTPRRDLTPGGHIHLEDGRIHLR